MFTSCGDSAQKSADLLVLNATVMDVKSGEEAPNRLIVISGDTIQAVLDMEEREEFVAVEVFDAENKLPVMKLEPAPNEIPYKLERGTQNHEGIAGLFGALGFIEQMGEGETRKQGISSGMAKLEAYEQTLSQELEAFLKRVPDVTLYRASENVLKTPTFAFRIKDINSREATKFFAEKYNLNIADGHFYASTMAELYPVMDSGGWIRIGFAPYNTSEEIEVLKKALNDLILGGSKQ